MIDEKNICNDYGVFIRIGNYKVTTKEVKTHVGNIVSFLNYKLREWSERDEDYKKYSIALNFLTSAMEIFKAKTPQKLTQEAAKITIEVISEIAMMESENEAEKSAIKLATNSAKFIIDRLDRGDMI